MYKVKITTGDSKNAKVMFRQLPGSKSISKCGKYQFFVDDEMDTPDFWVVRNKYIRKKETCTVSPDNTILLISEPKSVVSFPNRYTRQFAGFYSCQENVAHRNVVYKPPFLAWFVGIANRGGKIESSLDYDTLKKSPLPQKTKLISVITSNKAFTKGHQDRIDFVQKLKLHYGDKIDVFGRGFNDFEDKWDVLAPYKYHIALENSSSKYYWTEKLSDCYLAGSFPIYYGCTNIDEYFLGKSLAQIDINDFEKAVEIIDSVIENETYENNIGALMSAKELVLEDYNIFSQIAEICDTLDPNSPKQQVTLKPAVTILNWNNFYNYFIERNILYIKNKVRKIRNKKSILEQ